MVISRYQSADRAEVIALWQAVLPDGQPHNQPEPVIDAKLAVDDLLLVARLAEPLPGTPAREVVGTVMAGYDGHRGWLYAVAVAEGARRRGVGSALVSAAIAALRERGCCKLNLQVRAGNDAAVAFYAALGFETEARVSMGLRLPAVPPAR